MCLFLLPTTVMSSNTENRPGHGREGWELMKSSWKGLILYEARHTIHLPWKNREKVQLLCCGTFLAEESGKEEKV